MNTELTESVRKANPIVIVSIQSYMSPQEPIQKLLFQPVKKHPIARLDGLVGSITQAEYEKMDKSKYIKIDEDLAE